MNRFQAFALVAGISVAGSLMLALIPLGMLQQISDGGMWAIALMVASPAFMAVGVSFFIGRALDDGSKVSASDLKKEKELV